MTLPSSGAMRLGANVNVELGNSSTAQISLGQSTVRALYGVASGAIRLAADGYGKSSGVYQVFTTIGFQTWTVPSGITKIKSVEAIGGGAVGGGAYAKSTDITVTPGQTVYIRVGRGTSATATCSNSWINVTSNSQPTLSSQGVLAVCPNAAASGNPPGGLANDCVGTLKYSGGGSSYTGTFGGIGGGGAAGPDGPGGSGGTNSPSSANYYGAGGGGGGGGANGGSSGSAGTDTIGGNGGNGPGGSGGGSGSNASATPGGSATANTGGGGGGGFGGFGYGTAGVGGNGSMYPISAWGNYGPGGGGGGQGHSNPFGGGGNAGDGANYGGGSTANAGQGIVVIYY